MDNPFRCSRIMTCTQQTKCSKYFVLLRSFLFDIPRAMFFWLYNPDNYLKKTSAMKQNNKFSYWKNNYIRNTVAKHFLQITKQILYHKQSATTAPVNHYTYYMGLTRIVGGQWRHCPPTIRVSILHIIIIITIKS